MPTTTYDSIVEDIISCTNEVFQTMIPMDIKCDGSFYQKEDMISTDVISLVSLLVRSEEHTSELQSR